MPVMDQQFYHIVDQICDKDNRFHPEAYEFVMEALSVAQRKFKKDRHVSGQELLEGVRALTLRKFGPMALTVLTHWGIKSTDDFGAIVYNLVEAKVLAKNASDSYESFKNAYDFEEVFAKGYRQELAKRLKSMRF